MTKKSKISVLLTALGVVGLGVTAFVATKNIKSYEEEINNAEYKKDMALTDEEFEKLMEEQGVTDPSEVEYLSKKERAVIFAKTFWPTFVAGTITSGCNIAAQVLDIKEILTLTGTCAALAYKYDDAMNYIRTNFPDQYKEVSNFVNSEAAKRKLEESPKLKKEETYDGRKRYYFPHSDQIVYMKPEDLVRVQSFMSAQFGTNLKVYLNEVLDYIHQDLGYKDVHLSDIDYVWEFPDKEFCVVETKDFPEIELEYDDILEDDGELVLCQVVTTSILPHKILNN